jgi:DNA topoisomerase-1
MAKHLLIVESPTKAKTLGRYVGKDYTVKASVGHVKDLPKSKMGVDVENSFAIDLEVLRGKKKILTELCAAAKKSKDVLLAPDPDREGEAIAWHIAEEVRKVNPHVHRVTFNEITKRAVQEAIQNPRELDERLYNAQQARRVLDRLVGYEISPLLWDKVQRGLSAGRVQSVAVRLVVDREEEIKAFVAREYWTIEAMLKPAGVDTPPFQAALAKIEGKKAEIKSTEQAERIRDELKSGEHKVATIERKQRSRRPYPPFTTSKLQQAAASTLRFRAKKTMVVAQQLYEGVDVTDEGSVGLITYMRTDSTRIAAAAVEAAREFIESEYGREYLPEKPMAYKSKKGAQDAHEAIRPTDVTYTPEKIKSSLTAEQFKLYQLIWRQFVSCQMVPARYDQTTVTVKVAPLGVPKTEPRYELRATGSVCKFQGWLKVSGAAKEEEEKEKEKEVVFPPLKEGDRLDVDDIQASQHFTQPPPRFTEGTLVKEMEELGIGRPSTYAAIMDTIQSKRYVERDQTRLSPTDLGQLVTGLLVKSFPRIMDVDFTAGMEDKLDDVEEGKVDWVELMREFYGPFQKTMEKARREMRDVKREEVATKHVCDLCDQPMVVKWGRNGYFLACSGYPDCKNTKEIKGFSGDGDKVELAPVEDTGEVCEKCEKPMVIRKGRFGRFLACSGYPECKNTKSVSTGVSCPECSEGQLVERRSKKGKTFYSCNRYPKCRFSVFNPPVAEPCPTCGFAILVRKESKKEGKILACSVKGCGFKREVESDSDE